jgi:hypothetical protein
MKDIWLDHCDKLFLLIILMTFGLMASGTNTFAHDAAVFALGGLNVLIVQKKTS